MSLLDWMYHWKMDRYCFVFVDCGQRRMVQVHRKDTGSTVRMYDTAIWDYKIDDGYLKFSRKGPEEGNPEAHKRWLENEREQERDATQNRRINDPYEAWGAF